MTAYHRLEARFRRLGLLGEATGLLEWDAAAMMPEGGASGRAEQLATLRLLAHEILTAPETADLLAAAEDDGAQLGCWQAANLREMRRRQRQAAAVPADLVEALSRATSECEMIWRRARAAGDFAAVLPTFAAIVALIRELAAAKADAFATTPYEALVAQYEPGLSVALIDRLFDDLARVLPGLLDEVLGRRATRPAPALSQGPFPFAAQRRVAMRLMQAIGFDFAHGRLDESAHPFCGGTQDDLRITCRWHERDLLSGLFAALHETGHGLYERGLPAEWRWQPVGEARGMAVHESQSLLVEMQLCRGRPFLSFAAPIIAAELGGDWDREALYCRATRVCRGLIRVEADEVTYPLHVILRYRLEQAMIAGELAPCDLPGAWSEGLLELLGVAPASDREGCLQDIHWYDGAWGYFPTYTLGALAAAQLFAAARGALPDLDAAIAGGQFAPLFTWLGERVHAKASSLSTADVIASATGAPLGTASFERHLRQRYLG